MARLFLNRDLPNYFTSCDLKSADPETLPKLVEDYETGKVILLENVDLDFDAPFLQSVLFPPERDLKKFKASQFVEAYEYDGELDSRIVESVFAGDRGKASRFAEEVAYLNSRLEHLIERLFPRYRVEEHRTTWRLTETVNENLHIDAYREEISTHHVRLFVNLDDIPRIWHTSYTLDQMLAAHMESLDPDLLATASPGEICRELNQAVFGGWDVAGRDGRPRHVAFFDPGEVWLVDSRKVSHQIFYGRRALSTESAISPQSMARPETHYLHMVDNARRALLQRDASGSKLDSLS